MEKNEDDLHLRILQQRSWSNTLERGYQGQIWEKVLLSIFEKTFAQEVGHILIW